MIIGIDLDDTISNINNYKYDFVKDFLAKNNYTFAELDPTAAYIEKMFAIPEDIFPDIWKDMHYDLFMGAPLRENAVQVLQQLKDLGHTLVIVTARTTKYFENPYQISKDWLQANNVPYDKLIVNREDKDNVCKEEHITFFVDDYPSNIDLLTQANITTCLMDTPHNKTYQNNKATRVFGWQDVYHIIQNTPPQTSTK